MSKSFIETIWKNDLVKLSAEASDKTGKTRSEKTIWPSEAMVDVGPFSIGECKRALFYKIIGSTPTDPQTVRSKYICDAGLMFEKYHIDKYKELNMFEEEQYKIVFSPKTLNGIMYSGKIDLIIKENGIRKGIELKSVSGFKADDIFGESKRPLPAGPNLIQAMLYKYYFKCTEEGKKANVQEIYLEYVNRGDNATFYYEVDLDDKGYAILRSITQYGKEIETIRLQDFPSYNDLLTGKVGSFTNEDSRIAELRFSINDVFSKCDNVYTYVKNKVLPPSDYKFVYDMEDVELDYKCGRLSKIKYNRAVKSGETGGSFKCSSCQYRKKCLEDSHCDLK